MPKRKAASQGGKINAKVRRLVKARRAAFTAPVSAGRSIFRTGGFRGGVNEVKFNDKTNTAYEFSTTGTRQLLNGITQGSDYNNRIGRKFTMVKLLGRMRVALGATPTNSNVRALVVYDKQPNGAAFSNTDLLTGSSTTAFNNLNNKDRFIVLVDKIMQVDTVNKPSVLIKFKKNMKMGVTNLGTTNAIGDISTGSLYLLTLGDLATGVTAPVSTINDVRVRFIDE